MTWTRRRRVCVLTALVVLPACGGQAGPAPIAARPGAWRSNATGALAQLRDDVAATSTGSTSVPAARRALRNESDLFGLLVAYADLGGCNRMVDAIGAPPPVERRLRRPCPRLERAASTFTEATTQSDPAALVRAAREAHSAEPLLIKALLAVKDG